MDTTAAIGAVAAPGVISGILVVINWAALDRIQVVADVKRIAALVLGVGYALLAWQGGILEAENGIVAGLLGITFGLAAMGWHAGMDRVRNIT